MGSRFAIFDLGSNSIKFLVADVSVLPQETDGESPVAEISVVEERSVTTRLAEQLIRTSELSRDAMDRTLEALKDLRAKAEKLGATLFRAVATSAVRDSKNRKSFLREARAVLGFPVQLLSGEAEAETIFAGVSEDAFWRGRDLLVMDIGGGSAEWIQGKGGKIEREISMPLGCVRLRERFIPEYPLDGPGLGRLLKIVGEQIQEGIRGFELGNRLLVGTGGTNTCLATIHKGLIDYDSDEIHHAVLTRDDLWTMWKRLSCMTLDKLMQVPGLPQKRADVIVPGLSAVLATVETLKAETLHVSVRGLRYGVLEKAWREELSGKLIEGPRGRVE